MHLHYSCYAGMSGDMNLAALVDLGVPLDHLRAELAKLHLHGYELVTEEDETTGIKLKVNLVHHHHHDAHGDHAHHHEGEHHHRTFLDIRKIIEESGLSKPVKTRAVAIFQTLAEAEGSVHRTPPEQVHFHEVGAVDSIVDIVGACICLDYLNVSLITSSTVELGSGVIHCAHGVMTVPAPATTILAKKFPSSIGGTDHEATTPTGAAILATVVDHFENKISGTIKAAGTGIGHRQSAVRPNVLRVFLYDTCEEQEEQEEGCAALLEANIDDMTAEHLGYLVERLLKEGASDAWLEPIIMKKGRPGTKVCILCDVKDMSRMMEIFFLHSSTLGIRFQSCVKFPLSRETRKAETPWGTVTIKQATLPDDTTRWKPEFEDCRAIAERENLPLSVVMNAIKLS